MPHQIRKRGNYINYDINLLPKQQRKEKALVIWHAYFTSQASMYKEELRNALCDR